MGSLTFVAASASTIVSRVAGARPEPCCLISVEARRSRLMTIVSRDSSAPGPRCVIHRSITAFAHLWNNRLHDPQTRTAIRLPATLTSVEAARIAAVRVPANAGSRWIVVEYAADGTGWAVQVADRLPDGAIEVQHPS